jgi:hypothetical protein
LHNIIKKIRCRVGIEDTEGTNALIEERKEEKERKKNIIKWVRNKSSKQTLMALNHMNIIASKGG